MAFTQRAAGIMTKAIFVAFLALSLVYFAAAQTFECPGGECPVDELPACPSSEYAGCTGELSTLSHDVSGTITIIDDCSFQVDNWSFDGEGPAVEWWVAPAPAEGQVFDYRSGILVGDDVPAGDGEGSVLVRMGTDENGDQVLISDDNDHISVWCSEVVIDFGNAILSCPDSTGDEEDDESPADSEEPADDDEGDEEPPADSEEPADDSEEEPADSEEAPADSEDTDDSTAPVDDASDSASEPVQDDNAVEGDAPPVEDHAVSTYVSGLLVVAAAFAANL